MIPRYQTEEMEKIFSDLNKYESWLKVELAVLQARGVLGDADPAAARRTKEVAKINIPKIDEIELITKHDLMAFVESIWEQLPDDLKKELHKRLTSFDIEEPATSLILIDAMMIIFKSLYRLIEVLNQKADQYRDLIKILRTHGQHAEPGTQGLEFLGWANALKRQVGFLEYAIEEMRYSKISGAVGTYAGGLSPELEKIALNYLGLKPAPFSSQIILRDRHAHVMNALAALSAVLEHIALNIRLLGQSEILELQEPFGKGQKGSTRMPHKKNPILSENECGLARVVRSNAGVALENIATWGARDISHSSAERIIFPDSFHLVHFMIKRLTGVMEGIVVNEDKITENLNLTKGVIFSPDVKDLLIDEGVDPGMAYDISQQHAFKAIAEKRSYLDILLESEDIPGGLKRGKLPVVFNILNKIRHVDAIFERNGVPRKEREA